MTHPQDSHQTCTSDDVEARFLDPLFGDYIAVSVRLAADELFIIDAAGKTRARWRHADITHAFAAGDDQDHVLSSGGDDSRLVVLNGALFDAIRSRVPGLRRRFSESLRLYWDCLPDRGKRATIFLSSIGGICLIAVGFWAGFRLLAG